MSCSATTTTRLPHEYYRDKFTGPLRCDTRVMIVGDCPGKQVEGKRSYICWEGNRSGDFIHEIAIGYDGVMFTNTCQFEKPHSEQMREQGLDELAFKISTINPPCIICLGKVAKHEVIKAVDSCNVHPNLYFMDHPSFVLRFNKGGRQVRNQAKKDTQEVCL